MRAHNRRNALAARRGRTRLAGAAAVLLGAALLALAVPVAGAALSRVPGDGVLKELRAGAAGGPAAVQRLLDSRRAAARWRDDPRDLADRGLAQALLAQRLLTQNRLGQRRQGQSGQAPAGDAAMARLHAAERDLTAALGAAPADPYAWTRLALLRWQLDRPVRSVRAALDAARTAGPQTRRLRRVQGALAARLTGAPDG